jgi:gluconate kinase
MTARLDHFMPPALLDTQLATLEPLGAHEVGLTLPITAAPGSLAAEAAAWLRTAGGATSTEQLSAAVGR